MAPTERILYETDYAVLRDRDDNGGAYRLAVAKNVATNGRLFCTMLFVLAVVMGMGRLALLAALPVGLSVVVDQLPAGIAATFLRCFAYGATIAVFILLVLVNLG